MKRKAAKRKAGPAGMIQVRNILRPKAKLQVRKDLYDAMRQGLMRVIPRHDDGVRLMQLAERLKGNLNSKQWAGSSIARYIHLVKLDLEARKLIERIPGSRPQRLRRLVTY